MKKLIVVLIVLSVILSSIPTYAEIIYPPGTVDEAVQRANEQIGYEYYELEKVNREVWEKYGALVYGSPHGDKKGDEYRYLGETPSGEKYTNYKFPHDDWAGGYLEDRAWISEPWKEGLARTNRFNNKPEYEPAIEDGLKTAYGDYLKGTKHDWYKYMQILQPPTDFTPGMGRMWHVGKTATWYITVPIAPLKIGFVELMGGFPGVQDYTTIVVRTGTEGNTEGKPKPSRQNEAIIEFRVANPDDFEKIAEVEITLDNARIDYVEGLLEKNISGNKITGKLDMGETYAYGELQKTSQFKTVEEIDIDKQTWRYNAPENLKNYIKAYRSYKNADGNYGNITRNENEQEQIVRMVRVLWTVKDIQRPVKITSYIKPFEGEKNIDNNKDIINIKGNDDYIFSTFADHTISKDPNCPWDVATVWIIRPETAEDDLEDELMIQVWSWIYKDQEKKILPELHESEYMTVKINKDNPIAYVKFKTNTTPWHMTIWRKGKELEKYKNDEVFKDQYFMGYEQKDAQGNKYYYYKNYFSDVDGEMYPTKYGLAHIPEEKALEFIRQYGYNSIEEWEKAIRTPGRPY